MHVSVFCITQRKIELITFGHKLCLRNVLFLGERLVGANKWLGANLVAEPPSSASHFAIFRALRGASAHVFN